MGTITEVITVDATAPKAFFEGLADALESFGKLTDDEREHLPFRARHGLDILQRTCEEHLNGTAPAAAAGKGAAAEAGQQRHTFEFATDGPGWKGAAVVNGHTVLNVTSFDAHVDAESFPAVTVHLLPADGLKFAFRDSALIRFGDETREALVSLGWTPPAGGRVVRVRERSPRRV